MEEKKRIILTGGGSAGHVTPNLALLPGLLEAGIDAHYIGTEDGIERSIVEGELPYHPIEAGKLRRYMSWQNFTDIFRTLKGYRQAKKLLKYLEPDLVFAKGGFVSVPVVYAASRLKIPVVLHESDYTPGLANRLCSRKADKVCLTFRPEDGLKDNQLLTGSPVRQELLAGSRLRGLEAAGFSGTKPVLLIMGGSLGAEAVNHAVDGAIGELLERFDIIHLRGKGHLNEELSHRKGYREFEYVSEQLPDFYKAADIALSRAGANAVFEFAALRLPALLVPLPLSASRGDQILNAGYFERHEFAHVLNQDSLTPGSLVAALDELLADKDRLKENMAAAKGLNGTENVLEVLLDELA